MPRSQQSQDAQPDEAQADDLPPVPEYVPPWAARPGRQVWNADTGQLEDA